MLRREDGYVLRRENGDVLRRVDGHVLMREDGHVLRSVLQFEIQEQIIKFRLKRYGGCRLSNKAYRLV